MSNVYAEVGDSFQQVGGDCPHGWVQMGEQRPSPNHVAQADGTWIEKIPVPEVVSKAQAVLALHGAGYWPYIESYLNAEDTPLEHSLAWANITEVHRDSPTLVHFAAAAGLSDDAVDGLFREAITIKV